MTGQSDTDGGEQPASADALAEGIANDMDRLMEFKSDVEPDDVLETELKLTRSRRFGDGDGSEVRIAMSATTVISPDTYRDYVDGQVEPEVDKRKCPHPERKWGGKSVIIGTLTYTGEGEILDHHIQPEFRTADAGDQDE